MQTLYFLMGLFAGVYFTANVGVLVVNQLEKSWERQILAFTLTGYSEGWTRGRDYTAAHIGWLLSDCREQSQRSHK